MPQWLAISREFFPFTNFFSMKPLWFRQRFMITFLSLSLAKSGPLPLWPSFSWKMASFSLLPLYHSMLPLPLSVTKDYQDVDVSFIPWLVFIIYCEVFCRLFLVYFVFVLYDLGSVQTPNFSRAEPYTLNQLHESSASESVRNGCFNLERLSRSFRQAWPRISLLLDLYWHIRAIYTRKNNTRQEHSTRLK